MFVIEAHEVSGTKIESIGILGISKEGSVAAAYIEEIPEKYRSLYSILIRWIPLNVYPVYVIERFDLTGQFCSWEFMNREDMQKAVAGIERHPELEGSEEDDYQYMRVICLEGDWLGEWESRGLTWTPPHAHVDGELLDALKEYGEVNCGFTISRPA